MLHILGHTEVVHGIFSFHDTAFDGVGDVCEDHGSRGFTWSDANPAPDLQLLLLLRRAWHKGNRFPSWAARPV